MARTTPVPFLRTSYDSTHGEFQERNDCSVRAVMTVTGSTYKAAHTFLREECGRQDRRGVMSYNFTRRMDQGEVLGSTLTRIPGIGRRYEKNAKRITLARFIRENPVGTFLLGKSGHAFAVVDGKLVDTWEVPPGALVNRAWKVEKSTPVVPTNLPTRTLDRMVAMLSSGATEFTQADLEAWNVPASGRKYRAWWGRTNVGGRAAIQVGVTISMVTVDGEKVVRIVK